MDVLSQVALLVDNVRGSSNPVLFITKLGAPITFHLQAGIGEANLVTGVRKTVNNYGGRYVKRYHEMNPHTVLLVTDSGFRLGTYNRPAICVTYIGDSVHTNSLMNINEYLHPWDDQDRWKKIDLFEVVYHQNRMFQCTPRYIVSTPYVPVSRKIKVQTPKHEPAVENNEDCSELMEVSPDNSDLFVHSNKGTLVTSEATAHLRSSPCVDVQTGFSIRTEVQQSTAQPAVEKGNVETTNQKSAAPCEDHHIVPDDLRSTNMVNQQNIIHTSQNSQREMSSPSRIINPSEKMCASQRHRNAIRKEWFPPRSPIRLKSHQKRQEELRGSKNCKDSNSSVTTRNCSVKIDIIPEHVIQDESLIRSWTSGRKNIGGTQSSNVETGPPIETEEGNGVKRSTLLHSVTKQSLEELHQAYGGHGLYQKNAHLGLAKAKSKNVGSQKPPGKRCSKTQQKQSEEMRDIERKGDHVAKKIPRALLERSSVDDVQDRTSAQSVVSGQDNPEKRTGNSGSSTAKSKTVGNFDGESTVRLTPKIVSSHSVPSCSYQDPKPSNKTTKAVGKPSGKKCVQLKITVENPRKDRGNSVRKIEMQRRNLIRDQESDGEGSSSSDVECLPLEIPTLDVSCESTLQARKNPDGEQTLQGASTSTATLRLVTPKSEDDHELFKKRGRGYQDRYRRCEKVTMLKWLVAHKKFRNLRGVLVWREMEQKKVVPGRSNQSLKNQFLKHLMKKLDDYPFLTEDQKRKFRELDAVSSDEDDTFFYHGSGYYFEKTECDCKVEK